MFLNPMVNRGQTFYNGTTIDSSDLGGPNLRGKVYAYQDDAYNEPIIGIVVRNNATVAIKPKRLVTVDASWNITGYASPTATRCFPVDDQLTVDVPIGDLCLVIVRGPCLVKTVLAGDAGNVIAVGDYLACNTAAATTSTTGGRAATLAFSAPTNIASALTFYQQTRGVIGHALSAMTTAQTDADVLVEVNMRF